MKWSKGFILLVVFSIFFVLSGCGGLNSNDAMFRNNLRCTGVHTAKGVKRNSKVKWKFKPGGSVVSSPAVAEEVVYFGSDDGCFYAIQQDDLYFTREVIFMLVSPEGTDILF